MYTNGGILTWYDYEIWFDDVKTYGIIRVAHARRRQPQRSELILSNYMLVLGEPAGKWKQP